MLRIVSLRRLKIGCPNYVKILQIKRHTSTGNNNLNKSDDQDKPSQNVWGIKQIEAIRRRLDRGFDFGNWKFYPENLVFKNQKPDVVPPTYRMIYRSGLETYVNFGIAGAGALAIFIPASALWLSYFGISITNYGLTEISLFTLCCFAAVGSIYFLGLKVAMRIYYSEKDNNYLVQMATLVPYKTRRMVLQPASLFPPRFVSAYSPWTALQHTHIHTKQKVLINPESFELPMYYNRLLSYQ